MFEGVEKRLEKQVESVKRLRSGRDIVDVRKGPQALALYIGANFGV